MENKLSPVDAMLLSTIEQIWQEKAVPMDSPTHSLNLAVLKGMYIDAIHVGTKPQDPAHLASLVMGILIGVEMVRLDPLYMRDMSDKSLEEAAVICEKTGSTQVDDFSRIATRVITALKALWIRPEVDSE